MRRSLAAPGYEANCKKCIYRARIKEGGHWCKILGIINPHLIACCHYRTKFDTEETIRKRRLKRLKFWTDKYSEKKTKYNITAKYRKYIEEFENGEEILFL